MEALVLRATDVRDPDRWRWELTDSAGRPLAQQDVALEGTGTARAAFGDLAGYLRWHADPGDRPLSEAALLQRVGAWAGQHVLGAAVSQVLRDAGRVTVHVEVPADGLFLLNLPLELAHAGDMPLIRRGVALVWQVAGAPEPTRWPERDTVRILGLFSMPAGPAALAVRRERHALTRLVRELAAAGRAVHLEALQYGVTRQRLREAVADGQGWDVVHVCGHGLAGGLVLEAADGTPDELTTGELVELLRPGRPRLSLAVLSACESGSAVAAAAMCSMGLLPQAEAVQRQARGQAAAGGTLGLAQGLVRELGVAALGMRYALDDDFAVRLALELYTRLLRDGEPVDVAVAAAVPVAADRTVPALSAVTPVLVGAAAGLVLAPPRGPAGPDRSRLAALPPELRDLPRFVGRTAAMLAATGALATGSGRPGVVFRGMAGVGKTWCAAELAHHNEHRFEAVVWWSAHERTGPPATALLDLAVAVDRQLGDPADPVARAVAAWEDPHRVPAALKALLRDRRILLVLDGLDPLTGPDGHWRDPRWLGMFAAASAPGARSRLVVTTRTALDGTERLLDRVLHPLNLRDSLQLARELPRLRALLHFGEASDAAGVRADRELVRRLLAMVRGHPALLVSADAAAAVPADLATRLDSAERHGLAGVPALPALLDAAPELAPGQTLALLNGWIRDTLTGLDERAALLARLLATLQDDDRTAHFLAQLWPGVWRRLSGRSRPPDFQASLATLVAAALVEVVPTGPSGADRYRMHPATAETIRDVTPRRLRDLVAEAAGRIWFDICKQLRAEEDRTGQAGAGSAAVRAAFAAAPYLVRWCRWDGLGFLMAVAYQRDPSELTARKVIAYLDLLPEDDDPDLLDARGTRAQAFGVFDRSRAAAQLHAVRRQAIRHGRTRTVETAESELAAMGRPVKPAGNSTTAHPADPFPRLISDINQAMRRYDAGGHREALNATTDLLSRHDAITPDVAWRFNQALWPLRETVLRLRRDAAQALGDWETAVQAHEDLGESMVRRGASEEDVAAVAWGGVMPLILIDRFERAEEILRFCQRVLTRQSDASGLREVFTLRALVANQRGHPDEAVALQQNALRYAYRAQGRIGQAHALLGQYLARLPGRLAEGLAHRLALKQARFEAEGTVVAAEAGGWSCVGLVGAWGWS